MAPEPKSTEELQNLLANTHSPRELSAYLKQHTLPDSEMSFHQAFQALLDKYGLEKSEVIRRSNLDRTYAYQILNGKKTPGRDKVLALSIAAGLSEKEIRRLLEYARAGILYPRSARDSVILFGIREHLGLMDVNEMLMENGEKIIE